MYSASTHAYEFEPSDRGYRWMMLAGVWLAYSSFGLVSGAIPPLIGPLSEDLNLSRAAMGSILGAWPLVYIAMAVPAGALIDRFGLRRSLAAGVVLIAISGLLRAVAVNYATLFLAVALFGLGGPFISIGAPKLISVWFNRRDRGVAIGLYMTASPVGRVVALATANSILMPAFWWSWRLTLASYAGVALLAGLIWWALARDLRHPDGQAADSRGSLTTGLYVFPFLLRMRVVQIILVLSAGSFFFRHGFNNWLPEILRAGGMTAAQAGFWAALPILVGIGATVIVPQMAKPSRRIPMLVGIFLASGAAAVIVGTASGALLVFGLLLEGAAGIGVAPIIMLTLMDAPQVGAKHMGAAGGLYFAAGEVGGVLGPVLVGVVADMTGGFLGGLLMLAIVSVALAFVAVGLRTALRTGL